MNKKFTSAAFSLLELLMVLTISTILTLIALPSYHALLKKNYRQQAQVTLLALGVALQIYYNEHDTYRGAPIYSTKHYTITLVVKKNNGYRLIATPVNTQQSDPCGSLSMDETGQRLAHAKNCWE